LPEIDTDEYLDAVRLRPGVTYSPVLVENAIERLENLAIRNGLSFIRAVPRVTRNDADLTLDIEFVIERGERIFVERIDIEGNTTTLDRVIRRQFRIVEGDPFNPREIRQSAERIRALGLFANAEVTAREGSSPDRVIVDVDVEEQPTGSLSFGLNYSTDDGLGAAISFSERNFLGRGQTLRMSFESGTDNSNSEITFIEPAFLDRDLRLGLSAYLRETTRNTDLSESYDTSRLGFTPSLQFPVGENSRLGLRYLIEQDEISGISATDTSAIIKDDEGTRLTSAIGYTYTYDTRRGGLDPDAGVILQFSQDLAGLGGDAQYLRTDFLVGAERRFERRDLTLSAEFEGGALSSIDGNSRLTDRYFMGSSKMRGFERGGIGPRDLATAADDALGGNYYAVARFEAAFPLGLPEEYGLSGGLFYDIGSIWGLDDVDGGASGSDGLDIVDDSRYWRSVVGFSLFWDTQIGPLRFNFSKAIQKEDYDEDRAFDLTIEARF